MTLSQEARLRSSAPARALDLTSVLRRFAKSLRDVFPLWAASAELDNRLCHILARRAQYWIIFALASNLAIMVAAKFHKTGIEQQWGLLPFNLEIWSACLWILGLAGLYMCHAVQKEPTKSPGVEALWTWWPLFIVIFMAAWMSGAFALTGEPPKLPNGEADQSFKVWRRTFVWLTAQGHVVSLVLLSTRRRPPLASIGLLDSLPPTA